MVVNIVAVHRELRFMKESVLDVLIYLFDHYVEEEMEITPDQDVLKSQLILLIAGFKTLI